MFRAGGIAAGYSVDVRWTKVYMDAMRALPAWREWRGAGLKETWLLPQFEDFPAEQRLKGVTCGSNGKS